MVRLYLSIIAILFAGAVVSAAPPSVTALAYHPNGQLLAAGTHGKVALIQPQTGEWLRDLVGLPGRITAVSFSATGELAIAAGSPGKSGVIRLLDPQQKTRYEWPAHKDSIYALTFSPDGSTLASAGYDRVIQIWDTRASAAGKPVLSLTDHSDTVYGLAYHPSGKWLASISADRTVKIWDTKSGKRLYTLSDATDWLYSLAWSPDGKRVAAAGIDKSIRIWDVNAEEGKLVHSVFAHEGPVVALIYSQDNKTLYSVGDDARIKSWHADRLVEKKELAKQDNPVLSVALRPDGKQLAIGRFDGKGLFLDPETGKAGATFLPAVPKPPAIMSVTPPIQIRGQRTKVAFNGSRLDSAKSVFQNGLPLKATILSATPNRLEIETVFETSGAVSLSVRSDAGDSAAIPLIVDRYPAVNEMPGSDSAGSAQLVPLPATFAGKIDRAGDSDYYAFETAAGQQIGVEVQAAKIGSKLDPVLAIFDHEGHTLTEGSTSLGFVAPSAGRYVIGIRDRDYRGEAGMTYRLSAGPIPVITSVFPPSVMRGKSADVHVDGVNLGSPHGQTVRVTIPADAAIGSRVPVTLTKLGEAVVGEATVLVNEFPSVVVAPETGAEIRNIPGSADGILAKPGESQIVKFHAKKGERLLIETQARRIGSPVDTVIELLDAAGKPLPRASLRCVAKTATTFRDVDSSIPGIRLDTWNELAVNDYLYVGSELMRIKALPRNPDDDCQFVQVAGQRAGYLGTTPTHHAQNSTCFKVEIHPPGTRFPPNGMPVFTIPYRNDDGGTGYSKDSLLMFDVPQDGVYQVRVADVRGEGGPNYVYQLTIRHPRPDFTVSMSPTSANVWKNGAVPVNVTVTRLDGFRGPIQLRPVGLPEGYQAPEAVIEADQTTTTFGLFARDSAKPADNITWEARASIDGKEVVRKMTMTRIRVQEPGDLVTTTSVNSLKLQPGGETRFEVTIERREGFKGRVPLDVRGLPHGVRVLNIGLNGILITERDVKREVVLYAEPWVEAKTVPIVVLSTSERKRTEHAAQAVTLNIQK